MLAGGRVKTRADVRRPRDIHKRRSELGVCAGQVSRIGAATETFRCIYSNAPEDARQDRSRLADDLCDALIRLVRSSLVFTSIDGTSYLQLALAEGRCAHLLALARSPHGSRLIWAVFMCIALQGVRLADVRLSLPSCAWQTSATPI